MSKWISIQDQLPEINQDVLCLFKNGTMAVGYRYPLYEAWNACTGDGMVTNMDGEPIYWMPLPESPTTGGRDD